jgi:cytoskeletal protein RodZ
MMLNILVEGIATPPELEQFLQRNLTTPPQIDSLAEFSRQLAFFERPGRRTDIERLVGRAAAAEQMTRADEELKRLMDKAKEADFKPENETRVEQRAVRRLPTLVIAGALLLGAVALAAFWWRGAGAAPAQQEATDSASAGAQPAAGANEKTNGQNAQSQKPAPSLLERTTAAVRSAVSALVGSGSQTTTESAAVESAPAASETERPRARHSSQKPKIAAAPLVPENTGDTKPATSVEVLPMSDDTSAIPEADANVYNSTDATVIPPVMVRPVLPKDPPPGVPLHQIGTIDVWVDENGDVEQVRLMSPANRYQERMLVSAAKMWKFRPAFKDGHPVRYRTRVRLTV